MSVGAIPRLTAGHFTFAYVDERVPIRWQWFE